MNNNASKLFEWRELRKNLETHFSEGNLQTIITWWQSFKFRANGFDYDNIKTWPNVWELIQDGYYTTSSIGLGCFYTITLAYPDKDIELWLIHDLLYSEIYLVCYIDGYILNRLSGKLEKYEDVSQDINILEKHKAEYIIDALKFKE
jgi:hypothetical protein